MPLRRRHLRPGVLGGLLAVGLILPGVAAALTSHAGWPTVARQDEQINRFDANETLTAHPGVHNELLGGHGNDTLNGGNLGDILWGDYKATGQTTTQVDHINGGSGKDFIYASHGTNFISTGGGGDVVHAHFGRGQIRCGSPTDLVYLSHKSRPGYKLIGCKRISYKTLGY